ncbi:MAG TPA: HPF/RaiA family ribosome-associated protein, partial [Acidimicrobiales bacterium]|nr:HPF/RaiA family ribosome-associated protein [Acidimicrobiales bacterium]
ARAQAGDALAAVDRVLDKLEHRMEKLKGRLASRSHPHHRGTLGSGTVEDAEADLDGSPQIVRVARSATKPMTPEEATLELDLQSLQFCFFTNAETGRAAVVYRRGDGRFGLMDSS